MPLAALRGLANNGSSAASRFAFRSSNTLHGISISPRISNASGYATFSLSTSGMQRIVFTLVVTSSPYTPSPRVTPRTRRPFSYVSDIDNPSYFISQHTSNSSPSSPRLTDSYQSCTSCSLYVLANESIGYLCSTCAKPCVRSLPTRCVGELES